MRKRPLERRGPHERKRPLERRVHLKGRGLDRWVYMRGEHHMTGRDERRKRRREQTAA